MWKKLEDDVRLVKTKNRQLSGVKKKKKAEFIAMARQKVYVFISLSPQQQQQLGSHWK